MRSPGRTPFGKVTSSCLGRRCPDASLAVSVTRLVPPWANSSRDSSSSASRSAPWFLLPACSSRSQPQGDCSLENGPPRPPNRASKKSLKPPRSPPTPSLVVHVHSLLRPLPGGDRKSTRLNSSH